MDHVGEHGSGEIEAKHVYFGIETFLDKGEYPCNDIIVPIDLNDAIFDTTLLEYGETEPLSYISMILFLQNLHINNSTFIILSTIVTSLPPLVMYSIPLRVDTITLIRDVTACLNDLFFMFRISIMNSKLSVCVILKMSLLMSY